MVEKEILSQLNGISESSIVFNRSFQYRFGLIYFHIGSFRYYSRFLSTYLRLNGKTVNLILDSY